MIRRFVPVYLITGFIESGKTTLGLTVLANDRFTNGGKVLVLCCEEGETEWDDKSLEKYKGVLVTLDSADELTTAKLAQLDKEIEPTCVIMEYNTMWGMEKLDEISLPKLWDWAQVVTTADATTFDNYMTNMRKILTDPMKAADMIYVNRCGENFSKSSWRKQLRAMNSAATILFENLDGTVDDGIRDEDLPYDMKADVRRTVRPVLCGQHGPSGALRRQGRFPHGPGLEAPGIPEGLLLLRPGGHDLLRQRHRPLRLGLQGRAHPGQQDLFQPDGPVQTGAGPGRPDRADAQRAEVRTGQGAPGNPGQLCQSVR